MSMKNKTFLPKGFRVMTDSEVSDMRVCSIRLRAKPKRTKIKNAPIGLAWLDGALICITEYTTNGNRDAYIVSSGEYVPDDNKLVYPITVKL